MRTTRYAGSTLLAVLVAVTIVPRAAAQQATLSQAILAYEDGRVDEAAGALEALLDGPHEAQARLYLGRIHFAREEWDEAEDHLERAVELEPRNADFNYWLGSTYLRHIADVSIFGKRGMANKALSTLKHALEMDPDHVDARTSLAGYYLNAPGIVGGSKDKAREEVSELIERDAKRGYLFQAEIHEEDQAWGAAASAYDEALAAAPGDAEVLFRTGMFRQRREQWGDAFELLSRAARTPITSENRRFVREALYQVGRTGALSGESLDRAMQALHEFVECFPEREDVLTAGAHWRLGMILEMKGDGDAARASYEAALAIDPDHEEAKKALLKLGG